MNLLAWFRRRKAMAKTMGSSATDQAPHKVAKYWTRAFSQGGITTWMAEQQCRSYINELVSGSPHTWPMEWFQREFVTRPFPLGLSVGCGDGALERDVRRKGICHEIVGLDISEGALEIARQKAAEDGLAGISYEQGDFNTFELPEKRYEIVFFHQSMHHVANLEHCVAQIASTLKPGGLLYLDEYVGPSRTEWQDSLLMTVNDVYSTIPRAARRTVDVPAPVEVDDPSEAVRSSEICEIVSRHFTTLTRRDYGGNLLALIHPLVDWTRLDAKQKTRILDQLTSRERDLLRSGVPTFYSVIVASNSL